MRTYSESCLVHIIRTAVLIYSEYTSLWFQNAAVRLWRGNTARALEREHICGADGRVTSDFERLVAAELLRLLLRQLLHNIADVFQLFIK